MTKVRNWPGLFDNPQYQNKNCAFFNPLVQLFNILILNKLLSSNINPLTPRVKPLVRQCFLTFDCMDRSVTIHWTAVEQYFTVVLFVFQFFTFINFGLVHTYLDTFESANFSLWIHLPSTPIQYALSRFPLSRVETFEYNMNPILCGRLIQRHDKISSSIYCVDIH